MVSAWLLPLTFTWLSALVSQSPTTHSVGEYLTIEVSPVPSASTAPTAVLRTRYQPPEPDSVVTRIEFGTLAPPVTTSVLFLIERVVGAAASAAGAATAVARTAAP